MLSSRLLNQKTTERINNNVVLCHPIVWNERGETPAGKASTCSGKQQPSLTEPIKKRLFDELIWRDVFFIVLR